MNPIRRIAFIGNHLPRLCGIATFTHDLHRAVAEARPDLTTGVVAMTNAGGSYDYPEAVRLEIQDGEIDEYIAAAEFLNDAAYDVVCLQHEYGIFGGPAGGHITALLSHLKMPVVTTLHTVLASPTPTQRHVMQSIIDSSSKIVVMSEKGRQLLHAVHDVSAHKVEIIPHGIPDLPFHDSHAGKMKLGFMGKTVILTFGLLSPNKGIEVMLDAVPEIVKSCPDAVYVVLGATHPNLVRQQGETYRDGLMERVQALGIQDHVVFFNQFVEQATLLDFISMCDVYVTPYLNEAQMTSGTLAYSFGSGKAVVSTPYWHAKELLSDGRGILVPFGDSKATGTEIAALLANHVRRDAMRNRAYTASRSMTWPETAKRYLALFENACAQDALHKSLAITGAYRNGRTIVVADRAIPSMRTGHFLSLCDSTGILQHAIHSVPDRNHGYCVDDNARALLFASALPDSGEAPLPDEVTTCFAAFIQHAWNPGNGRFRNFMSYEREWLEASGSEDSHGRTLWALAECARGDTNSSRRRWAAALFKTALPAIEAFSSPRAWAFSLLGLNVYCALQPGDLSANDMRTRLADRLMALFQKNQSKDWLWFEDVLAYDNARLPQALIQTGLATHAPASVDVGLRSMRWLMSLQTTPMGTLRPVGSQSFGKIRQKPAAFDQQPIEACATISACLTAWRADQADEWLAGATRAFGWFTGENDLGTSLVDSETGSCSDGLHPDRRNENKGAESVLSYLLGLIEIRKFVVILARQKPASKSPSNGAGRNPSGVPLGSIFVPIPILKPPEPLFAAGPGQGRGQAIQTGD
jgi:glycosyltransferase involved in cell wall biosynthesis